MVRQEPLAGWRCALPRMRFGKCADKHTEQDAALPLSRAAVSSSVQREDRNCHAGIEPSPPDMGSRHLPLPDRPQGRVLDEVEPGSKDHAEKRVASGDADTEGNRRRRRNALCRAGRSRRNFRWWKAQEHEPFQAEGTERRRTRRGGQGSRGWRQGSRNHQSGAGQGVVPVTDTPHVAGFVASQTKDGAKVYTDEARVYNALDPWFDHESVNHKIAEYVREQAHTNGMESFWSMLKRGYQGTYHKMSAKHLDRYVTEFSGRHNVRDADTVDQMDSVVTGMAGKRLRYADLIADNGLSSGARS